MKDVSSVQALTDSYVQIIEQLAELMLAIPQTYFIDEWERKKALNDRESIFLDREYTKLQNLVKASDGSAALIAVAWTICQSRGMELAPIDWYFDIFGVSPSTVIDGLKVVRKPVSIAARSEQFRNYQRKNNQQALNMAGYLRKLDVDAAQRGVRIFQEDAADRLGCSSGHVSKIRQYLKAFDAEYSAIVNKELPLERQYESANQPSHPKAVA